jgi:hypothetical protein
LINIITIKNLQNKGIFLNAQAIIFGQLHGNAYSDTQFSLVQKRCELIIKKFAQKIDIPVLQFKLKMKILLFLLDMAIIITNFLWEQALF